MKALLSILTSVVGYIGTVICSLWTIVSFIIYLVKDIPFNWNSLWSTIACIAVMIVSLILTVVFKFKMETDFKQKSSNNKRSPFQERLEEMARERNSRITPKK